MIPNWIWRSRELNQIREINVSLQRRHRPMGSKPMDSTDLTHDIARGMDVREAIAPKPYFRV